ncbi:vitamin K epoxide reductase family protein [Winogradskyella sp.]|uniref:vitamin K epoxide reductase family protein n=1 Tax=Winogradskyella sp. TaxID=1883156 RepID=UPI00262946B4|nr:vitamin K epoxide reductase family protein [Winogradskyella sp.]
MDNCVAALKTLLRRFHFRYTNSFIEESILSHPDYPSLLCISDTLQKYGIENLPVKADRQKLKEFPLPCLIQLSVGRGMFYVLIRYSKEETVYLDDKGKRVVMTTEQFLKKWTGVCLLAEPNEKSKEPGIEERLSERKSITALKWLVTLSLVALGIVNILDHALMVNLVNVLIGGYAILKFVGLVIGVMLLWYEVDKYNPTLQRFCSGGEKVNCDSVLNSKYSKILNGQLSLGLIGFAYFFGTLSFLLFTGFSKTSLVTLAYLSFGAVPFILLSAYYQGIVIKQWCRFCVIVQGILVSEILVVFLGKLFKGTISFNEFPLLITLLLLPVLGWKLLKPLLEKEKETNLHKRGLKKIKNNPDVLHGLLSKTRKITTNTEGLGISFVNKNAKYNVLKVCSPYCGPCAGVHSLLEELYQKEKINLKIIFTTSIKKDDKKTKPVRHFMAIDSKGDKAKTQKALDDWYLSEEKNYETFANRYPINGELEAQDEKIEAMGKWCSAEKITYTPTIFINGRELPREYSAEDLKEVLG